MNGSIRHSTVEEPVIRQSAVSCGIYLFAYSLQTVFKYGQGAFRHKNKYTHHLVKCNKNNSSVRPEMTDELFLESKNNIYNEEFG